MKKEVMLTGVRPSGNLTIGNYLEQSKILLTDKTNTQVIFFWQTCTQ